MLETDPPRLPSIRTYRALGFQPEPILPAHDALWSGILRAVDEDHRHPPPALGHPGADP